MQSPRYRDRHGSKAWVKDTKWRCTNRLPNGGPLMVTFTFIGVARVPAVRTDRLSSIGWAVFLS